MKMKTLPVEECEARVRELEIKLTFLERRLEEQDAAALVYYRQLERLEREMLRFAKLFASMADAQEAAGSRLLENEKPPHY
jgi:uncharacterized coiled-coil protein SlyX